MAGLRKAHSLTHSPSALRALMRRFDISPSRALGQNFVIDPNTVRRMGKLSGAGPGDRVIEVGAGLGSLTLALAETGASVTAVEADRRLVPALRCAIAESGLGPPAVEVIEGDARALDWDSVLAGADRWLMVSNLPYNLAVPLVLDLLRGAGAVAAMVVMVQKEVGERLAAPPGARGRGIPSVLVESYGSARVVAPVPASVFFPRPRVESAIVRVDRAERGIAAARRDRLERVVRAGFSRRRKMLRRSLTGMVDRAGFDRAGVDPTARPETLTLDQWLRLADESSEPD